MRRPRLLIENAIYHVTAKANRSEFIFDADFIKDMFLDIVEKAKKKYDFRIKNFCIMSNHIHFMIKPLKDSCLSDIMRWILGNFAVRFNNFYGYHGHVWYDRFKSVIFRTIKHYYAAYEYINNNPVKAGLIDAPENYYYCGLFHVRNNIFKIIDPPS